jgi:hypothetical protein
MEKRYKKADQRGLYIEMEPNGSKLWCYKNIASQAWRGA